MNLDQHYDEMWNAALDRIQSGRVQTDPRIDKANDDRRGITLIARLNLPVQKKITAFLEEMKLTEPEQCYYLQSDLHITIMSIVSCFPGFSLDQIQVRDYTEIIARALGGISRFEIQFIGLTASPSSILVRGFPSNDSLQRIREALRVAFQKTALMQSMDQRYKIKTAHCTAIRFRNKINDSSRFLTILKDNLTRSFGVSPVRTLDLVFNDWYMKEQNTWKIEEFTLPGQLA